MRPTADIVKIGIALVAIQLACVSQASWYWPFGSDDTNEVEKVERRKPPRISELMQEPERLIDEANDFQNDGDIDKVVEKYREALRAIDRVEEENAERAKSPEFATIRHKRAFVNARIDGLLLMQVKSNAKGISLTDTTELEKRLAEEKGRKGKPVGKEKPKAWAEEKPKTPGESSASLRKKAMDALHRGEYEKAGVSIDAMLAVKPESAAALNLKAVLEIRTNALDKARLTLDRCIHVNENSYFAYYNMCELMLLQKKTEAARSYYRTGRRKGGPRNKQLEALLK